MLVESRDQLLTFFVNAIPVAQGSVAKRGRNIVAVSPKLAEFRDNVRSIAIDAATAQWGYGWEPLDGPLFIRCRFYLPRPQKPLWDLPAVKPDGDKLLRAIQDSLSCVPQRKTRGKNPRVIVARLGVITDDARFVAGTYHKYYAVNDAPGVSINIGKVDLK